MITDVILFILIAPVLLIIAMLPTVSVSLPSNIVLTGSNIFAGLGYFLPMPLILSLIGIKYSLKLSRVAMALVIRIKSFIPTMGA